jgi:hypothetical protein
LEARLNSGAGITPARFGLYDAGDAAAAEDGCEQDGNFEFDTVGGDCLK